MGLAARLLAGLARAPTVLRFGGTAQPADCDRLIAVYERYAPSSSAKDYTGHPVVHWSQCREDAAASEALRRLVADCHARAAASSHGTLYPEAVMLAAIGPGGHHPRHADNCRLDEDGAWVPNHTPQRAVSAICYLNHDFEGGEIVFLGQRLVIKPRRGLLVVFPSDGAHVHEVLPVRSGRRYSVPIWFTREAAHLLPGFA